MPIELPIQQLQVIFLSERIHRMKMLEFGLCEASHPLFVIQHSNFGKSIAS